MDTESQYKVVLVLKDTVPPSPNLTSCSCFCITPSFIALQSTGVRSRSGFTLTQQKNPNFRWIPSPGKLVLQICRLLCSHRRDAVRQEQVMGDQGLLFLATLLPIYNVHQTATT